MTDQTKTELASDPESPGANCKLRCDYDDDDDIDNDNDDNSDNDGGDYNDDVELLMIA